MAQVGQDGDAVSYICTLESADVTDRPLVGLVVSISANVEKLKCGV